MFPKDGCVLQKVHGNLMSLHLISLPLLTLQITNFWNINNFHDYKTCLRAYQDRKTKWKNKPSEMNRKDFML